MNNKLACAVLLVGTLTCPSLAATKEDQPEKQKVSTEIPLKEIRTATSLAKGLFGTLSVIIGGQLAVKAVKIAAHCVNEYTTRELRYVYRTWANDHYIISENTVRFTQVTTELFLISYLWKNVLDELIISKDKDSHQDKSAKIAA